MKPPVKYYKYKQFEEDSHPQFIFMSAFLPLFCGALNASQKRKANDAEPVILALNDGQDVRMM